MEATRGVNICKFKTKVINYNVLISLKSIFHTPELQYSMCLDLHFLVFK